MPVLVVLSIIIAVYSITRPGALAGVKYFLVPNLENFSWMTVVSAMGQMFYSLSIAMGILVTFGSYMKKDISIEESTTSVEIFDTAIAIMAGLMIIPAVFAFSGGDPNTLQCRPFSHVYHDPESVRQHGHGYGHWYSVFCAGAVCGTDQLHRADGECGIHLPGRAELGTVRNPRWWWGVIMLALGTLSSLGYGPLAGVTIIGMQFLDFFDFLTNSVMMPIAAIATCLLVSRVIGMKRIEEEVLHGESKFKRKRIFYFMIQYLCPIFAAIIFVSSVANAFGWISM